jgi:hypothetical protein
MDLHGLQLAIKHMLQSVDGCELCPAGAAYPYAVSQPGGQSCVLFLCDTCADDTRASGAARPLVYLPYPM